jgi:hypothetical protein
MLASEKPSKAAPGKKGKKDGVDDLLTEAEKAAPMPETKVKHDTPEWAKPEIRERAYTPPPPVATAQPKEKPNDGIIRVVQGAAGSSSGSAKPAVATTTRMPPAPAGSGTRKQAAAVNSRPGEWADPFSDPSPRKGGKQVAAKRQVVEQQAEEEEDVRPVRRAAASVPSKREASRAPSSGDWDDPFSDGARKTTGTRRAAPPSEGARKPAKAAPARGGKWDDPFTSDVAPGGKPGRPVVASREPAAKHGAKASVTPTSTHRVAAAAAPAAAPAQGRWGVLKKRR